MEEFKRCLSLLNVRETLRVTRVSTRMVKRGESDDGKEADDGYYYEEFDESEPAFALAGSGVAKGSFL